jgi:acetyltransferase-like isoleucine patch superfamily enzyme
MSAEVLRGHLYYLVNRHRFGSLGRPLYLYRRVYIRHHAAIRMGRNVTLAYNCFISPIELEVGDNCWLGVNNFICGKVHLGRDVQLGPNVNLPGSSHNIDSELPVSQSGSVARGTIIEDYAWIGGNVTVLDGVRVGKGAVVGAGSVVTRDVPPFAVVAGAPARILKYRKPIREP